MPRALAWGGAADLFGEPLVRWESRPPEFLVGAWLVLGRGLLHPVSAPCLDVRPLPLNASPPFCPAVPQTQCGERNKPLSCCNHQRTNPVSQETAVGLLLGSVRGSSTPPFLGVSAPLTRLAPSCSPTCILRDKATASPPAETGTSTVALTAWLHRKCGHSPACSCLPSASPH